MSQQDLMCDVERLDRELHQQIQWKLEACKKAEDLQSKLTEMEQCLQWCSETVWRIEPDRNGNSGWFCISGPNKSHDAPTLYAALHSAWKSRDTTKDL